MKKKFNVSGQFFEFSAGTIFSFVAMLFLSCQSLQQDKYVLIQEGQEEIVEVELKIASLETSWLLSETGDEEFFTSLDSCIKKIDSLLSEQKVEQEALSKLTALKGKCFLLEGKKTSAKNCYDKAASLYKGEVNTVILSARLGLTKEDIESLTISSDLHGFLTLEKAMNLYQKKEYRKAGAKFDEAFISIPLPYRQCYEKIRNSCWSLRESSGSSGETGNLIKKEKITLGQMLILTQSSGEILYKYTASKSLNEAELFRRTEKAGLFTPYQDSATEETKLTKETLLTRRLFARFVWNLKHDLKLTKGEKNKYSKAFEASRESPVLDIPYDDRDFDAILGSVEEEILELPDAQNFYPEKYVSGSECNKAIKKLK